MRQGSCGQNGPRDGSVRISIIGCAGADRQQVLFQDAAGWPEPELFVRYCAFSSLRRAPESGLM